MSAQNAGSPRAEELLRHAEFVRRLARSLLHDAHLAEDVAQDALVAGLTGPPPRGPSLRAWLAGVVRNRVRMQLRSGARRVRRERAARPAASVPQPDEVVARLETGRGLVDAVLALEEPCRTAIVLRYFDDLSPTEIALRTGVPLDTVKSRLRRALDRLRARMDDEHPRGRAGWGAALLPVAGWKPVSGAGTTLFGGTAMAAKSKLVVIAAAVLLGVLVGAVGRDLLPGASHATLPAEDLLAESAPTRERATTAARTTERGDGRSTARSAPDAQTHLTIPLGVLPASDGAGTVGGRVATADGVAIPGAVISAAPEVDAEFDLPSPDPRRDLDEWARATVQAEARRRARGGSASSDADGRYEIRGLGDAPVHLTAAHPSYDLEPSGRSDGRWVRAGGTVDFVAVPVASVHVDVLGPAGKPVDEAVLVVRGEDEHDATRIAWTPEDPELRLRPGSWAVEALARNGELRAAPERVVVAPPAAPTAVVLHLGARVGIRGRVLHAPAGDTGFVFVHLLGIRDGEPIDDAIGRLVREGKRATTFGVLKFRYRYDDLEPGRYVLGASMMGGDLLVTQVVTLADAAVEQELLVPERGADEFVEVRALGPDGKRLAAADVALAIGAWTPPVGYPSADVERGADGTIRVRRQPPSGPREGQARLVVRSREFGERVIPFDPKAVSPLEIRFEATAALDVTVVGAEAPEVHGTVTLALRRAPTDGPSAPVLLDAERRALDASGTLHVQGLQPGEYEIALHVGRAGTSQTRRVAAERVSVCAGPNRSTVTLPRISSLIVEVPGAGAGEHVQMTVLPGGPPLAPEAQTTDANGRTTFDLLPPGTYHLTCTVDGRLHVASAELPGDAVLTLRPLPTETAPR